MPTKLTLTVTKTLQYTIVVETKATTEAGLHTAEAAARRQAIKNVEAGRVESNPNPIVRVASIQIGDPHAAEI